MKKQLLTAIFAFAPFFATAQPSDAELLAHLKNVKKDIQQLLQNINNEEKKLKKKLGNDYILAQQAHKELHSFFEQLPKKNNNIDQTLDYSKDCLNLGFNLICDEIKPLQEVSTIIMTYTATRSASFMNNIKSDPIIVYITMTTIINKYFKNIRPEEFFNPTGKFTMLLFIIDTKQLLPELLKKVDAKITQLEKQV